jgi:uncharacterized Zn-binding protein involved in type VI secretion
MGGVCRVGDVAQCFCKAGHGTPYPVGTPKEVSVELISGSTNVNLNGMPVAIVGSVGVGTCGHHTEAVTGSNNVYVNGMPIHRVGDAGVVTAAGGGDYEMISGSSDTNNEG